MSRMEWLEGVAYWAKQALLRREVYEALTKHPDESTEDLFARRDEHWKQVQSADAMVRINLTSLERESGPVSLKLARTPLSPM